MTMTRTKIAAGRPAVDQPADPHRPESPQDASAPGTPIRTKTRAQALQASPEASQAVIRDVVGEEVTVSWGEEKISPRPNSYSACTTGAIYYKTRIQPGESAEQAIARAYAIVRLMGENFRREKLKSFLQALDEAVGAVARNT